MKTVKYLIASIVTVVLVSLVTLDITIPIATLVSFIGYLYLTEKVFTHITEKKLPSILGWIDYALVFAGNILLIAGLRYRSVICLIIATIFYISSLVVGYFDKKNV